MSERRIEETSVIWVGVGTAGERTSHQVQKLFVNTNGLLDDRHGTTRRTADTREQKLGIAKKGDLLAFNPRQATVLARDEIFQIARNLDVHSVTPEDMGANMVLDAELGFTEAVLGGSILYFPRSEISFWVTGPNERCAWPGRAIEARLNIEGIAKQFKRQSYWLGGVTAAVYRAPEASFIQEGDACKIIYPAG